MLTTHSLSHKVAAVVVGLCAGLGAGLCGHGEARAQAIPAANQFHSGYTFAKAEEVKKVEWKASASAGLSLATGNANFFNLSGGANVVRNDGKNKLTLDMNGVYATTTNPVFVDRNNNMLLDSDTEIGSETETKAGFLLFQGRYDRFFTANNSAYFKAYVGTDFTASKKATAGAQLGFSRQLFKTVLHDLQIDLGGDYNYTNYLIEEMMGNPNAHIASARISASYNLQLGENTRFEAGAESLINLNPTTIVERYARTADATKLNAKLSLTTKVWNKLSFRFGFSARFDNCPAPNTKFKFAAYSDFGANVLKDETCNSQENALTLNPNATQVDQDLRIYRARYNQKLDTLTEANLVFNFL